MMRVQRDEQGVSLVEVLLAMVVFALVIVSVDASVSALSGRSNDLSQSNQAIDQLQVVEQTLVTDLHAASLTNTASPPASGPGFYQSSSCSSSAIVTSAGQLSLSSTNPISFYVNLNGSKPCVGISMSSTSHSLTIAESGSNLMTIYNLDSSSSLTVTCTSASGALYCTSAAVNLTQDTPRVGAPKVRTTTLSDPQVEVWNQEYACEAAGGTVC
jgi:Tfp pilus assembly protein PilV